MSRRKPRTRRPGRKLAPWLGVAALGLAALLIGVYLWQEVPRTAEETGRQPPPAKESAPVPTPYRSETRPLLAIVIDDVGGDLEKTRAFLDLEVPVTLAILPHLAHSEASAELARQRDREFLLHQPMQPRDFPANDPGLGALLEGMGEEKIRGVLAQNLASLPGAAGVNNHMGSRMTELEAPMSWVLEELRSRGLFFLDSYTSGQSVAVEAARRAGVLWARRDVFLDNVREVEAIAKQLDKAVARAEKTGRAIAIGHPHAETLEALRQWARTAGAKTLRVVAVSRLLRGPEGA